MCRLLCALGREHLVKDRAARGGRHALVNPRQRVVDGKVRLDDVRLGAVDNQLDLAELEWKDRDLCDAKSVGGHSHEIAAVRFLCAKALDDS